MSLSLNEVEIRILGCLIEKQLTTPDYYPLTLNSLIAACNQKSNREPVMNLSESQVQDALSSLQDKYLVREKMLPGSRTPKYEHKLSGTLTQEFDFNINQLAVLSILFVRGPQTVGEIKGRTQRMADFLDLDQVEACLQELQNHAKGPFVKALPRQPGRREIRYGHVFGGEVQTAEIADTQEFVASAAPESVSELQAVKAELAQLREEFENFKNSIKLFRKF